MQIIPQRIKAGTWLNRLLKTAGLGKENGKLNGKIACVQTLFVTNSGQPGGHEHRKIGKMVRNKRSTTNITFDYILQLIFTAEIIASIN